MCSLAAKERQLPSARVNSSPVYFLYCLFLFGVQHASQDPVPCSYDEVCPPGSVEPGDPCQSLYVRNGQVSVVIF